MSDIFKILLPVFTVIALGYFARKKQFITDMHVDGVNTLVYTVLFPIMIFNAFFTARLQKQMLHVVIVVFILHVAALLIGSLFQNFIGKEYGGIAKYHMATAEGGNILFPLYATIVGTEHMSNAVMIDISMIFIAFIVFPVMMHRTLGGAKGFRSILWSMLKSPMIISFLIGSCLNLLGVYRWMEQAGISDIYDSIAGMLIVPMVTLILFTIGYRFQIPKKTSTPLLKTMVLRMTVMALGAAFIILAAPSLASNRPLRIALMLQCACPPSLMMPTLIAPVIENQEQRAFISAFLSLYIAVTLVAYTLIVILA